MDTLPIINKTYELYKLIINLDTKLEKRWRYGLGISTENTILACLEHLILAKNAPKQLKTSYLIKAQSQLEIISLKLRLLLELRIVNETKIFQAQAMIREIGRMLGGWLKSLRT